MYADTHIHTYIHTYILKSMALQQNDDTASQDGRGNMHDVLLRTVGETRCCQAPVAPYTQKVREGGAKTLISQED